MYAALWRVLPGPWPVRVLLLLLLLAGVLLLLALLVFPAVEGWLPLGDVTVDGGGAAGGPF